MSYDYSGKNAMVLTVGIKKFAETEAKRRILKVCEDVAQHMVWAIDGAFQPPHPPGGVFGGNDKFPVWTDNMHDATGVGIYDDGKCYKYIPTKRAEKPQNHRKIKNIWGNAYLEDALSQGATKYSKGIWFVVFCAVPYAETVHYLGSPRDRGVDFFDKFSEDALYSIIQGLEIMNLDVK